MEISTISRCIFHRWHLRCYFFCVWAISDSYSGWSKYCVVFSGSFSCRSWMCEAVWVYVSAVAAGGQLAGWIKCLNSAPEGAKPNHTVMGGGWGVFTAWSFRNYTSARRISSPQWYCVFFSVITAVHVSDSCDVCQMLQAANVHIFALLHVYPWRWEDDSSSTHFTSIQLILLAKAPHKLMHLESFGGYWLALNLIINILLF